jgi:hypothetical protein
MSFFRHRPWAKSQTETTPIENEENSSSQDQITPNEKDVKTGLGSESVDPPRARSTVAEQLMHFEQQHMYDPNLPGKYYLLMIVKIESHHWR